MSLAMMKQVRGYRTLKGADKLVMIGIADVANDEGVGWIKVADLAEWASITPRSVSRILARLEADGYIERRIGMGGFRDHIEALRPNLYTILPEPSKEHEELSTGVTRVSSLPPDTCVIPPPDTCVTPPPDTCVIPHNNDQQRLNNHSPLPPKGGAPGFDQVFAEYPRQTERDRALRVWQELQPSEELARQVVQSIRAWRLDPSWQREGGRFVPRLWRWLRDRRWEDVPGIAPAPRVATEPRAPGAPAVPPSPEVRAKMRELLERAGRKSGSEVAA